MPNLASRVGGGEAGPFALRLSVRLQEGVEVVGGYPPAPGCHINALPVLPSDSARWKLALAIRTRVSRCWAAPRLTSTGHVSPASWTAAMNSSRISVDQ